MGWIATIFLGVIGSLAGGLIAWAWYGGAYAYEPAGWIMSIFGAGICLLFYYWVFGRRRV
jgi:uncharacterized membrane protein YeaQ/YmgE (transglycosylase-associated protein family)